MDTKNEALLLENLTKLATAIDEQRTVQIPFSKAKIPTAFNPSGEKTRPRLTRPVWFNGAPISDVFLTNEEIELVNQLKPGRYNNRKWQVIERTDNPDKPIEIRVTDERVEDRMELYKEASNFAALCKVIIGEQNKQNK